LAYIFKFSWSAGQLTVNHEESAYHRLKTHLKRQPANPGISRQRPLKYLVCATHSTLYNIYKTWTRQNQGV